MTPRQSLIPLDEPAAWRHALHGVPHAFAHTWASCSAMQMTTGWPTFLWVLDTGTTRTVLAIAERTMDGFVDAVTPYGFGGFAGHGAPSAHLLLKEWRSFAAEREYVCSYIGLSPVLAPAGLDAANGFGTQNDAFVLDLTIGEDALFQQLSPSRRRHLSPLRSPVIERGGQELADFLAERVGPFLAGRGAGAAYAFTADTWRALLSAEEVLLLGMRGEDSRISAVCALARTPFAGDYLFSVSRPDTTGATEHLLWAGALDLLHEGVPTLNLGGGVRPGDGVAEFKRRFGASRLPIGALTEVHRQDAYDLLCSRTGVDQTSPHRYFPAYREPALAGAES